MRAACTDGTELTGETMGFFTKDTTAPEAGALEPLSRDRLTAVLDARELQYGIDDDGDVGGYWDGHLFYFFLMGGEGEYLQTRGRWNREVGIERLAELTALVNTWNAEKLCPRRTCGRRTPPSACTQSTRSTTSPA